MSHDLSSVFTFDLNESLRFQNGQGVAEMIGISLDPEISIQTFPEHVSIRGIIELSGEYFAEEDDQLDDESLEPIDQRDFPGDRFMSEVNSELNGVHHFRHHFPVEISIPNERIEALDDIFVGVDTFDYQLPERGKMLLRATVAIHGLKQEREFDLEEPVEQEEMEHDQVLDSAVSDLSAQEEEDNITDTFRFDVKENDEVVPNESERDYAQAQAKKELADVKPIDQFNKKEDLEGKEPEIEVEKEPKEQKSAPISSLFDRPIEEEKPESKPEPKPELEPEPEPQPVPEVREAKPKNKRVDKEKITQLHAQPEDESGREPTYLLDIFSNVAEEERFSRLKVYIVQESDTLETIAERYQVKRSAIEKVNDIIGDGESLASGQLVYIPN